MSLLFSLDLLAQQLDVGGAAHEGHGDEIHLALEGEFDVGVVLFGQRGQLHVDAGQVDVAAAAHRAGRQDLADELVVALLDRACMRSRPLSTMTMLADFDVLDEVGIIARRR